MHHCLYLASKYCKDFKEKVDGYMRTEPEKYAFAVNFYQKKK